MPLMMDTLVSPNQVTTKTRNPTQARQGSSPQEESPPNTRKPTSPPVEAELDCEPSTKRDTHDVGKDTRGLGLETFDGRGAVRRYKGSKRPPKIPHQFGGSARLKKKLKP